MDQIVHRRFDPLRRGRDAQVAVIRPSRCRDCTLHNGIVPGPRKGGSRWRPLPGRLSHELACRLPPAKTDPRPFVPEACMVPLASVLGSLERHAPTRLAADWDNVGLLLGDRTASVTRIMTCLTVTPESAAEAVERQANLIITHHPILFRPVKRLTSDDAEGRMLLALARAGVAVYSPHTALDN